MKRLRGGGFCHLNPPVLVGLWIAVPTLPGSLAMTFTTTFSSALATQPNVALALAMCTLGIKRPRGAHIMDT